MRKIIIIGIIVSVGLIIIALLFSKKSAPLNFINTRSKTINVSNIEGQMEFVKNEKDRLLFLTYRGTAIGSIDKKTKQFTALTEQVLPSGIVDDLTWSADSSYILLRLINDPYLLGKYTDFKTSDKPNVFATYKVGDGRIRFIESDMDEVFLLENKLFGIKDKRVFEKINDKWSSKNLEINKYIISKGNKSIGIIKPSGIEVYNSDLKLIGKQKLLNSEQKNLRIFSDGTINEIQKNKISIQRVSGETNVISLTENDQVLFGEDIILFTKDADNYGYFSSKEKVYKINNIGKNLTYLDIFALSEAGGIYPNGKNDDFYQIDLWEF